MNRSYELSYLNGLKTKYETKIKNLESMCHISFDDLRNELADLQARKDSMKPKDFLRELDRFNRKYKKFNDFNLKYVKKLEELNKCKLALNDINQRISITKTFFNK